MRAEAAFRWTSVQKLGIAGRVCISRVFAGQVSRSRVLHGMCAEARYCLASVQKQGIAGQVCRIRVLLSTFTQAGY